MIDPMIDLLRGTHVMPLHTLIGAGVLRLEEDGIGLPDVRRLVERGPAQHGDTDIGYRLEPRIINLVLLTDGDGDISAYRTALRELAQMLRPSPVPLYLRYTMPPDGAVREIAVAYIGGMTLASSDRSVTAQRVGVQLRAADPTFFDPDGINVAYTISAGTGAWNIPWEIDWNIGSATVDSTQAVQTPGDWESYPIIIVQGPINNLRIRNLTTGDDLNFAGYNIALGGTLTIDTRYGVKSVIDETGASQIDKLSESSDLATFRIAADPEAPNGVNNIRVTGSTAAGTTAVFVQFNARYLTV
jgi:hypothetical protein